MGVTALVVGAVAAVASTVYTMTESNKQPSPAPDNSAKDAQAAAQAQAQALAKRRGFASTIMTSPTGVQGAPTTSRATLGT
jgi:branched-subunit amino acid aminotransferase/4-amino-4-deoxychorismate lyase